ncbi:MAG TPA: hypothetical protein VHG28_11245 [Longimicrobiaceae bacterium]|nr:hypothetical protein [Longimicrobiaceae bacterium]
MWLTWAGTALLLAAVPALLDLPWIRDRVMRRTRAWLGAALLRARSRATPEPLAPYFRDLEEAGAALVMGAAVSGLLFLLFGPGREEQALRRLLLALPGYLGVSLVVIALLRLALLAPRALRLWLVRIGVLATERVLRGIGGERLGAERVPFTYLGLLLAEAILAVLGVVALARWWGGGA